ncbi:hypothetical protein EB001_09105 [bacterium]|jgi:hypothetical protein|nr:hypothetical protein [bacterium]
MWAVLDYDGKTVVGVYPPDCPEDVRLKDAQGRTQILMTLENSPAYVNGTYENGKFSLPVNERNNNG